MIYRDWWSSPSHKTWLVRPFGTLNPAIRENHLILVVTRCRLSKDRVERMKFKEEKAVDSLDLYLAFLLILLSYLWWNRLGVIIENLKIFPELAHLQKSFRWCAFKVVLVPIVFYILIYPLLCSLIIPGQCMLIRKCSILMRYCRSSGSSYGPPAFSAL